MNDVEEQTNEYLLDLYADPPLGAGPPTTVVDTPLPDSSSEVTTMRPDITKVQIIALVQAVIGLLTAFGLELTQEQRDAIIDLVGQLGIALILADAGLRAARNISDRPSIKP